MEKLVSINMRESRVLILPFFVILFFSMPTDGIGDRRESSLATSGVVFVVFASGIRDPVCVEHCPDTCGPFGCARKTARIGAGEGDKEGREDKETGDRQEP